MARPVGRRALPTSEAYVSRRRQLVDQLVDLRLARDVDAARRLVEHQHVDVVVQQPRDRDLLLVAAGQLARPAGAGAAADAEAIDPPRGGRVLPRRQDGEARDRDGSSRDSVRLSATLSPSARPSPARSSLSMPIALPPPRRAAPAGPE